MGLRAANIASNAMISALISRAVEADNVANALTPAFRGNRSFPSTLSGGAGSTVAVAHTMPQHGSLILTGSPLDFAIGGPGFFILDGPDGPLLTRLGAFHVNADGLLVDANGRSVRPGVHFPAATSAVSVNSFGDVIATGSGGTRAFLGTLILGAVVNPEGLIRAGDNTLRLSAAAGPLARSTPGHMGFGLIVQGGIEASNVDFLSESVRAIVTNRAFQSNATLFRLASAMAGEAADMAAGGRRPTNRIDLSRTQAAGLAGVFGDAPRRARRAEPLNVELHARLAARRMSAPGIAELQRVSRKHIPERFDERHDGNPPRAGKRGDHSVLVQELMLAQRRAAAAMDRFDV